MIINRFASHEVMVHPPRRAVEDRLFQDRYEEDYLMTYLERLLMLSHAREEHQFVSGRLIIATKAYL